MIRSGLLSEQEVRQEVERHLQRRIRDKTWTYLVDEGWVRDIRAGQESIADLVSYIREQENMWTPVVESEDQGSAQDLHLRLEDLRTARRRMHSREDMSSRQQALSLLIARELAKNARVQAFRANVLRGKLVRPGAVIKWTKEASTEDAEALYHVARHLADHYGGELVDWLFFVLTGDYCVLDPGLHSVLSHPCFPARSRVVLTIDPALSPEDVARYYSDVRGQVLRAHPRSLSEKHQGLAIFAARRPEHETWAQRMAAWNERYPDWRYKHESNFGRDCVRAQRRLLGFGARAKGTADDLQAPPASYDAPTG